MNVSKIHVLYMKNSNLTSERENRNGKRFVGLIVQRMFKIHSNKALQKSLVGP